MNTTDAPLVSIIIPVYNVAPFLTEALDSAFNQTYDNLEIMIVDDGSTDGSGSICDAYAEKDSRIVVIHQHHQGLSVARNAGLDMMSGEYVAFLDSDDAFHPDFIRRMLTVMLRENPDIVVCRYKIYKTGRRMNPDTKKNTYPPAKQGKYDRAGALSFLADEIMNRTVWNKLYKRRLWSCTRFPGGHNFEDIDTTYRIFDKCRSVYIVQDPLYLYRNRPGSIVRTYSADNIRDRQLAFEHMRAYVASHIPDIFTEEQLRGFLLRHLRTQIRLLTKVKGKDLFVRLREQIISLGNEIGMENCGFQTRTAYRMVCRCPWLLKMIYPIYRVLKDFHKKNHLPKDVSP